MLIAFQWVDYGVQLSKQKMHHNITGRRFSDFSLKQSEALGASKSRVSDLFSIGLPSYHSIIGWVIRAFHSRGLNEFGGTVPPGNCVISKEWVMKVQTGIKAGAQGGAEASHGGKPRPIGKGV